jgi:hypothetical protein
MGPHLAGSEYQQVRWVATIRWQTPTFGEREPNCEQSMARTREQLEAAARLRVLAARYKIQPDAEGWPIIPGRLGRIEWYCDGIDCHSCPLPGRFALAVYTDRPRIFGRLWSTPGVRRHQTADTEMRAVFTPEAYPRSRG